MAVIAGPTASGKGSVAHELAKMVGTQASRTETTPSLGCEIISMDSMKVYREMNVATAKPSAERRQEVRYHLVDVVDPSVEFSVADYLSHLEASLAEIASRGGRSLLSGGTPLYLKAFLEGFRTGPAADWKLRTKLIDEARDSGPEVLHVRLSGLDPQAARKIHVRDLRRIVRALEVLEGTGRAISEEWSWGKEPGRGPQPRVFGLAWDRAALYGRIDRRVEAMVSRGLFEEALRLRDRQPPLSRSAAQSLGYKEIWAGLAEGRPREEIIARIQQGTRRFAKRQLTWLRKLPITWIPVAEGDDPREIARGILRQLEGPR